MLQYRARNKFTEETLIEMFGLREDGWTYSALGRKFDVDHSTIMYHCRRYGIEKGKREKYDQVDQDMSWYAPINYSKPATKVLTHVSQYRDYFRPVSVGENEFLTELEVKFKFCAEQKQRMRDAFNEVSYIKNLRLKFEPGDIIRKMAVHNWIRHNLSVV